MIARTKDFWDEKTSDPALADKTILVASHGCAVRALLQNVDPDPKISGAVVSRQTAVSILWK